MPRQTDIVVTTIWEPAWLQGYLDNLRAHGQDSSCTLRIICDRKTPASVYAQAEAARRQGFRIDCPTLDEQSAFLRRLGLDDGFIRWDTDNRRNIGFLRAWESGADVMISIDDDNYCEAGSDFIGEHGCAGRAVGTLHGAELATGAPWFNLCTRLRADPFEPIFPRGYPYGARGSAQQARLSPLGHADAERVVAINSGLWLADPDVDAITRLALRPTVHATLTGAVVLGRATWSPINTQNTALMRAAVPAYYYVRMGYSLQGMKIDRFGDILSGYFAQKCVQHLGHAVRIGSPVSKHLRTPHNLLVDLYNELAGVAVIEDLMPWLQEIRISGSDYAEAYAALADALDAGADRFKGFVWDQGGREFLRETAGCMRTWLAALARLS